MGQNVKFVSSNKYVICLQSIRTAAAHLERNVRFVYVRNMQTLQTLDYTIGLPYPLDPHCWIQPSADRKLYTELIDFFPVIIP